MLKPIILLVIPIILLYILFYLINFRKLRLILKTVIENRPFDEKNSKSLRIMSITFIAASFLFEIAGSVLLAILSGVFMYGNYLQEEYDETI